MQSRKEKKMSYKQQQAVTVLKNKGLKENRDFRIVYFGMDSEIKIIQKPIKLKR